jgi:hypothetical protein
MISASASVHPAAKTSERCGGFYNLPAPDIGAAFYMRHRNRHHRFMALKD